MTRGLLRQLNRVRQQGDSKAERLKAMNLTELGQHFKTDKATLHRYTQHYERHFGQWRNDAFNLLEIGIGGQRKANIGGKSLRMWKSFFPNAQIVGLDLHDKEFARQPRIHTYQGDQSDPDFLRRVHDESGPFRIIIDDGSHRNDHVRASFEVLFPLLEDGGIYAIEDTQTSYWPNFGGSEDLHAQFTTMAMVKDLIDGLNYVEFTVEGYEPTYTDRNITAIHCYHNLVIMEKGSNVEGTTKRPALTHGIRDQSVDES
jgi:hypothetical protein